MTPERSRALYGASAPKCLAEVTLVTPRGPRATMPRMVSVRPDAALSAGQSAMPVLWQVQTAEVPADYPDAELAPLLPRGRGIALRSFGHDADGVHWLLTRAG